MNDDDPTTRWQPSPDEPTASGERTQDTPGDDGFEWYRSSLDDAPAGRYAADGAGAGTSDAYAPADADAAASLSHGAEPVAAPTGGAGGLPQTREGQGERRESVFRRMPWLVPTAFAAVALASFGVASFVIGHKDSPSPAAPPVSASSSATTPAPTSTSASSSPPSSSSQPSTSAPAPATTQQPTTQAPTSDPDPTSQAPTAPTTPDETTQASQTPAPSASSDSPEPSASGSDSGTAVFPAGTSSHCYVGKNQPSTVGDPNVRQGAKSESSCGFLLTVKSAVLSHGDSAQGHYPLTVFSQYRKDHVKGSDGNIDLSCTVLGHLTKCTNTNLSIEIWVRQGS